MIKTIIETISPKKHPNILYFAGNTHIKKCLESKGYKVTLSRYHIKEERIDMTNIKMNKKFDVVVSEHVMEHITNDILAYKSVYNVLNKGGYYFVSFPININKEKTDETKRNIIGRIKNYGQHDHVRIYGTDVLDRIKDIGFYITLVSPKPFGNYDQYIKDNTFCLILKK